MTSLDEIKNFVIDEFQYTVQDLVIRNKSILDLLTKYQDSCAKVNRGICKSVTQCGCITIDASKQHFPSEDNLEKAKEFMETHVHGELCESCRDVIEKEIGKNLFFLTSLCNTLDLNIYDIILKELNTLKLLGNYILR